MKTILLLLWLLEAFCCYAESTELKSFHGNSAYEVVETSKYDTISYSTQWSGVSFLFPRGNGLKQIPPPPRAEPWRGGYLVLNYSQG